MSEVNRRRRFSEVDVLHEGMELNVEDREEQDLDVDHFLSQKFEFSKSKRARHLAKLSQVSNQDVQADPTKVSGVIERVSLKNFMCHENFVLDFGPRLNFIIGHNGSGKSAILTGISICLGAKASETNRGSNLKDLIKEGANSSSIQVVLSNEGIDAYEPGKYGSKIIIERNLRRDTTSAPYILKSENGKRVSTKKSDLDAILDYHNIAVNNPMAFLSQDAARSFLTASTDDQKYKFFMRGTLMDEIHKNIKQSREQVDSMSLKIIRMKEALIRLKDDAHEAEKLHERLLSSRNLRERQRILHGKYFWMQAERAEEVVREVKESQDEIANTIKHLDAYIKEYESKITDAEITKNDYTFKIGNLKEKESDTLTTLTQRKRDADEVNKKLDVIFMKHNDLEKQIKQNTQRMKALESDIAKEEQKIKEKNGGSLEALQNQKENLETKLEEFEAKKSEIDNELSSLEHSNKEFYNEIAQQIQEKRESIQRVSRHISRLKGSKQDELDPYHDSVKRAMQEIHRTQFSAPAVGPLGTYISLKPGAEKWGPLLEAHLGANFNTFLVENFRDHRMLQQILKKYGARCNIVIRKPERFNYDSGRVPEKFTSVLDLLHFKDENVKYALIDMAHIESVIIADSRKEAQNILEANHRNVNMVLSPTDRNGGQRSQKTSSGGFRVDPLYFDNALAKLRPKDRSHEAGAFERRIQDDNMELKQLESQKQQLTSDFNSQKQYFVQEKRSLDANSKKIKSEIYQITLKLNDAEENGKLEALLDDKVSIENENMVHKAAIAEIGKDSGDLRHKVEEKLREYNEIKKEASKIRQEIKSLELKVAEAESDKHLSDTKRQHFEKSKEKRIRESEEMTENLPAWEKSIEENKLQAEESCSKEEADQIHLHDIDAVKVEIEKVTARVNKANEDLGKSPEEILQDDENARKKFTDAKLQFDQAVENKHFYHASLNDRLVAFRESRAATFWEADMDFKASLQFRNFSGNLDFDVTKNKLTMYVSTKNDRKPRHVDSLSGGEKSFSQISLLLATWKPMRSRIKGLDEFDVFMDQVNRKIGMRLMLQKLSKESSQTIFITPQDIGQIADLDERFVRIHRIKDPRAGRQN